MLRIAIAWEETLPTVDASPLTLGALNSALRGLNATALGASDLSRLPRYDLLVIPFGSAFPKEGWPEIATHLEHGGSLLNLGGVPFTVPCNREHMVWEPETRQAQYRRELGIRAATAVPGDRIDSLEVPEDEPLLAGLETPLRGRRAFAFSFAPPPGQSRSPNRRVRPLLYGLDQSGARIVAPIIAIDHLEGPYDGSRWVFAAMDGELPVDVIRRLAFYAAQGPSSFTARPSYACYAAGEEPQIALHLGQAGTMRGPRQVRISLTDPAGGRCECEVPGPIDGRQPTYRWVRCVSCSSRSSFPPGFYTVEATLVNQDARKLASDLRIPQAARAGEEIRRSGFWVRDSATAAEGADLTLAAEGFRRGGAPYPLVGALYAGAADASPLAEPDAGRWDRDFAAMRAAGFNVVRAGLWHRWPSPGDEDVIPDEACLRALDALLLTAHRHGLLPMLALFDAGSPIGASLEPYLEGQVLEAQREWMAAIVARCRAAGLILWDLADVPSLAVCAPRADAPNSGETAQRAWLAWVSRRSADALREAWRLTPRQSLSLPGTAVPDPQAPAWNALKALDYRRFAAENIAGWLGDVQISIRLQAGSDPFVTAGWVPIDGAPASPALTDETLDFSLVPATADVEPTAAGALARISGKPSLLGAVPAPCTEDGAGEGCFSEEEDERGRVEQMLAWAVAAGCAGALPWAWHPALDAPAAPGLLRADGSCHPALAATGGIARFLERNRQHLDRPEPEPVAMLVPESLMHYDREQALRALDGCLRACSESGLAPRAVSEYSPGGLADAQMILAPAPRVLGQAAWEALLQRAAAGATIVLTGPLDDEYWRPRGRLSALGIEARVRPTAPQEPLNVGGRDVWVSFCGAPACRPEKAVIAGDEPAVLSLAHEQGRVLWSPLPLELAADPSPAAALYQLALDAAGVAGGWALAEPAPEILACRTLFAGAALYALLSQAGADRAVTLLHGPSRLPVPAAVPARRAVLLLVERESGREIDRYSGA